MVPDSYGIPVKMSKSLGNFVTIKDALAAHPAEVIRTLILSGHYANPITISGESFESARNGWERLMGAVRLTREKLRSVPMSDDGNGFIAVLDQTRQRFVEAMDDDFNAPAALATLYDLTREVNGLLNSETTVGARVLQAIDGLYTELGGGVLGIIPEKLATGVNAEREEALIRLLIDLRAKARAGKNFAEADRIRNEMASAGITLEDRSDGTIWRFN
jgi:cysteinyl-tRNA synthetase